MKVRTFKVLNSKGDIELIYLKPHYGMEQHEIQNVNDYDEDIFNVNVFKLYEEKQQLISWLEDKIKEIKKENKTNGLINGIYFYNITKIDVYREVLDFVNKGGKDE